MTDLTVLIVDDELEFAEALAERLAIHDIAATIADSGEAALDILNVAPIDVVVLDVCMPGMDGIETLERIRDRFPETGVIMLSGHADINTAVTAMKKGAFDYLVKPVQLDELLFRIQDAHNTCRVVSSVGSS
jgi:DNA-binding NtrC family response regulator